VIRPIVRNILLLSRKSEPATEADRPVIQDLLDTLASHWEECVGMAANMIGVNKRIIAVNMGMANVAMVNPVICSKKERYETEEGCLSLIGKRPCFRYRTITVRYQDANFQPREQVFTGLTAQIIQHECDHLEGIII